MRISRTLAGTLLAVGATLLWGVNGTVSRVALDGGLSPLHLTEIRITAAAAILLVFVTLTDRAALRLARREVVPYALFGAIGLVCVQWTYFEAIARIPISISLIIEYLAPLMVALWVRIVWKRRLPWLVWVAIPIACAGLGLALGLQGGDLGGLSRSGVLWSLGAGATYAYYALHAESLTRRRSPAAVLALGLGFGSIVLALALPWWSFPFDALAGSGSVGPLELPAWAGIAYIVVLGTVLPFTMIIAGVQMIGADGAIVTAMLEPIFAGVVAWIALGQVLTPSQIVGGAVVLAAVAAAQIARARAGA